ncbi:MAG: DUF2167 domain-containing protein [Gammaproteobacteria bacterium]
MLRTLSTLLISLALGCAPAFAADSAADSAASQQDEAAALMASFKPQQGRVTLPGNIATLNLPASFRYLNPKDSARLLTEGWGNPPGGETLGMIIPADVSPLSAEGWGVVITYDKDGHVKDDDASSIKYDELLKDMQENTASHNDERKKAGYPAMTLVGWAEPPRYDAGTHKLYWAQHLHSEGSKEDSLNYNIRVLGREGVLILNAVAGMDQIAGVKEEMKKVTAFTDFTDGNRYADFNSSTDKVAEYGIAALIAGGAAAKLGLFGKLFAVLLAFKKVLFLAGAALVSFFWKLVGRKKEENAAPPVDLSK